MGRKRRHHQFHNDDYSRRAGLIYLPVFVYGTLRPGHGNYWLLDGSYSSVQIGFIEGYTLYDNGLPYVKETPLHPENRVWGNIFTIQYHGYERMMQTLDDLEGYDGPGLHNHYDRAQVMARVPLNPDEGDTPTYQTRCWAYLAGLNARASLSDARAVESGDWIERSFRREHGAETAQWWIDLSPASKLDVQQWMIDRETPSGAGAQDATPAADDTESGTDVGATYVDSRTGERFTWTGHEWESSFDDDPQPPISDDEYEQMYEEYCRREGMGTGDGDEPSWRVKDGDQSKTMYDYGEGYSYHPHKRGGKSQPYYWMFAYGSNLDPAQMQKRAGYLVREAAYLDGWRLAFNKEAWQQDAGYANIEKAPGCRVEGALYLVSQKDLWSMDGYEGEGWSYLRAPLKVKRTSDGTTVECEVYIAHPLSVCDGLKPTDEYLEHLLNGCDVFSDAYMQMILDIETVPKKVYTYTGSQKGKVIPYTGNSAGSQKKTASQAIEEWNQINESDGKEIPSTSTAVVVREPMENTIEAWAEISGLGGEDETEERSRSIHAVPLSEDLPEEVAL